MSCEALWVALRGEVASELTSVLAGNGDRCSDDTDDGNSNVVECVLSQNLTERNPRNRLQSAYTQDVDVSTNASSCRVGLVTASTNGIRFNQYLYRDSVNSRTFHITIE